MNQSMGLLPTEEEHMRVPPHTATPLNDNGDSCKISTLGCCDMNVILVVYLSVSLKVYDCFYTSTLSWLYPFSSHLIKLNLVIRVAYLIVV